MAKFRIGERARIIAANLHPELLGRECVITEVLPRRDCIYYRIDIPGAVPPPPKKAWAAKEHHLEKLTNYDGWQKSQWADCPWKPKTERREPCSAR